MCEIKSFKVCWYCISKVLTILIIILREFPILIQPVSHATYCIFGFECIS